MSSNPAPANVRHVATVLEDLTQSALMEDHGLSAVEARIRVVAELDYYRGLDLSSHELRDLFRRFCLSLANRGGPLFNVVFGGPRKSSAFQHRYASVLAGYDPAAVFTTYAGQDQRLCRELLAKRGFSPEKRKRQLSTSRSGFAQYARGVLAGAEYFSRFSDGGDFARFVTKWLTDRDVAAMLPQHFAELIPGFGYALAADFLKEVGVKELGKPDRWVRRVMGAAGWIHEDAPDVEVEQLFWLAWEELGDEYQPVIIDKLMYLVGTGNFAMVTPPYACSSRFAELQSTLSRIRRPA